MKSKTILLAGAALFAIGLAAPAFAQGSAQSASDKDNSNDDTTRVSGVTITAEKREQNLQDVPLSVSAVDAETRNEVGILTIQDMAQYTPGFSYNTTTDRPTIRGVGRQTNSFTADSPVANYFDGVYTSSVQDASRRPMFIERTEILRGPQGALSGRGSIAGSVNTISKKPSDVFGGEVGGLFGSYRVYGAEGTLTGPITPWLQGRVNYGNYNQDTGYFRNVAYDATEGDQPNNRVIYDLLFTGKIGENFDFFLKGSHADYDETRRTTASLAPYAAGASVCTPSAYSSTSGLVPTAAYGYFDQIPTGCQPYLNYHGIAKTEGTALNNSAVVLGGVTTNPVTADDLRLYNSDMTSRQWLSDHHDVSGEFTYHTNLADIKYIGGHQKYIYNQLTDADGTAVTQITIPSTLAGTRTVDPSGVGLYQEERTWFSHELNITSNGDGPVSWILGAYQSFEDFNQQGATTHFYGYAELNTPGTAPNSPATPATNADPFRAQYGQVFGTTRSTAAFGQIDYKPTDKWQFTFGLRYNKDEKKASERTRLLYNNDPGLAGGYYYGLYPGSLDITYGQAPGFDTISPGATVPDGYYTIDPSTQGWSTATIGGVSNYVLPNGGGYVPVGKLLLMAPGTVGLPETDSDGNRVRYLAGDWSGLTGDIGINYTPNDNTLLYARFSRGYRPGGFNAYGFITSKPEFDKETVDSYEVGEKMLIGTSIQLNSSLFYYDYRNIQQPLATYERCTTPGDFNSCTSVNSFVNLPSATNTGLEVEGIWFASDNLRFTFTYAYLDAHLKNGLLGNGFENGLDPAALLPTAQPYEAIAGCVLNSGEAVGTPCVIGSTGTSQPLVDSISGQQRYTQDLSGNPLPNSPRNKIFINAGYTLHFNRGDLLLSGTYIWRSKSATDLFNSQINDTPAYSQINLRAVYNDKKNDFQIIAYVNNLLDENVAENYFLTRRDRFDPRAPGAIVTANAVYYPGYDLAPPRTVGVEMSKRF